MNKLDLSRPQDRIFSKILRRQALENGATEFLVNDDLRITFAAAEEISNRLASGLAALGLNAGDRVGFLLGNRPEFVLLALAANKLGAIWVPINTDYKGEWLLDSVARSRCQVFITDSENADKLLPLRDQLEVHLGVIVRYPS